jgi:hypothetical protein
VFTGKSRQVWAGAAILIVAIGFAWYVFSRPMDFRVYHYGARGVFDGTRPVYGPTSGMGWPMHYRYPPFFLLLFAPFAMLPLGWGAAVWVVLKVGVLVLLLRAMLTKALANFPLAFYVLPFLFIAPYLVEDFRYGNAQFFVFALSAAALLTARGKPIFSGATLALAISIKVWPLFFIPYLAVKSNWKVVLYASSFVVVLTLLPSFYFGFWENLELLGQWFTQESQTQLGEAEIWFANQSLRGVLMRYLTVIDYSQVPDSNYPQIHIANWNPQTVRMIWIVLAAAIYAAFLTIAYRRRDTNEWLEHGVAFCLIALLEPFSQKYALVILLWPALAASAIVTKPRLRILLYAATALALIQPLAPGAGTQRFLQVLGLDFGAALLLMAPVALLHARMRSGRIL